MNTAKFRAPLAAAAGLLLVVAGAAAFNVRAAEETPAQGGAVCARYDELVSINMIDSMTAVAATRRGVFQITFRASCQVRQAGGYFVMERDRLGQCIDAGDLFRTNVPVADCVVASVAPLESVPIRNGQ